MLAITVTPTAEVDLVEIWLAIARDKPQAADKQIDRFHTAFQTLAANPGIGQAVDRYRKGLRCFSVGIYVIFFKPTDEQLVIYRVLHGARDLDAIFKRPD